MTAILINQIKAMTAKDELRNLLSSRKPEVRQIFLENAIDSLNKEIESDISLGNVDVAIYKMSQVVMLEDEKHIVERIILKQAVVLR